MLVTPAGKVTLAKLVHPQITLFWTAAKYFPIIHRFQAGAQPVSIFLAGSNIPALPVICQFKADLWREFKPVKMLLEVDGLRVRKLPDTAAVHQVCHDGLPTVHKKEIGYCFQNVSIPRRASEV